MIETAFEVLFLALFLLAAAGFGSRPDSYDF